MQIAQLQFKLALSFPQNQSDRSWFLRQSYPTFSESPLPALYHFGFQILEPWILKVMLVVGFSNLNLATIKQNGISFPLGIAILLMVIDKITLLLVRNTIKMVAATLSSSLTCGLQDAYRTFVFKPCEEEKCCTTNQNYFC